MRTDLNVEEREDEGLAVFRFRGKAPNQGLLSFVQRVPGNRVAPITVRIVPFVVMVYGGYGLSMSAFCDAQDGNQPVLTE